MPPHVAQLRATLAVNVLALMRQKYPAITHQTNQIAALVRDAGIGKGTIERILRAERDPQIDKLAHLGRAFRLPPHELLNPYLTHRMLEDTASNLRPVTRKAN